MTSIQPTKTPQEFGLPALSKTQVQSLLEHLPTTEQEEVTHIGFLENPSQINGDLEGPLLSVSVHPEDWEAIARLGGCPWWEITSPNGILFLDMVQKCPGWEKLENWGTKTGIVLQETWWQVPTPVGEDDEVGYFLFKEKTEAKENEEPECGKISPKKVLVGTPGLVAFWQQRRIKPIKEASPWQTRDMLACYLLESAIHNRIDETPDGLWWNETHDPGALSSPRGGICPNRLVNQQITIHRLKAA